MGRVTRTVGNHRASLIELPLYRSSVKVYVRLPSKASDTTGTSIGYSVSERHDVRTKIPYPHLQHLVLTCEHLRFRLEIGSVVSAPLTTS